MQDDPDFIRFHIALNRDARMYDRYKELFQNRKDNGGDLFMHFVDVTYPSKFCSWGALEYVGQDTTPKWKAIQEFTNQTCWWEGS